MYNPLGNVVVILKNLNGNCIHSEGFLNFKPETTGRGGGCNSQLYTLMSSLPISNVRFETVVTFHYFPHFLQTIAGIGPSDDP
jgi:hypothetical protein